jgi:AraC-like DNA-binding protein
MGNRRRQWTAHSPAAQILVMAAATQGLDPAQILARFEIDPLVLADPDGRIPLETLRAMWLTLPELCSCPDLALVAAHLFRDAPKLPLSAHIFLASPTLGDAIRRVQRYERVMYDNGTPSTLEHHVEGERAWIRLDPTLGFFVPPPAATAFEFATFRDFMSRATQREIPMLEADLRLPEPPNRAAWDEHFGVRVRFGAAVDGIVFPAEVLSYPHPSASESLALILERYADGLMGTLPPGTEDTCVARVKAVVRSLLPDGLPSIDEVARRLGASSRSLQRQLAAAGVSFREIVDELRRELSLRYLESSDASIADVAFRLGFADQPSFHRAFVRWTGATPGAYRQARRTA